MPNSSSMLLLKSSVSFFWPVSVFEDKISPVFSTCVIGASGEAVGSGKISETPTSLSEGRAVASSKVKPAAAGTATLFDIFPILPRRESGEITATPSFANFSSTEEVISLPCSFEPSGSYKLVILRTVLLTYSTAI